MKKIIVAPLNWGLGHASRCIPIISNLLAQGFTPVLASDGAALELLVKEFPSLEVIQLPSYGIRYGKQLKYSLFLQVPRILKTVRLEKQLINRHIEEDKEVVGIISDNRFGVRSTLVTSVYLSHQLKVLSGSTTFLTSLIHQWYIKQFDECWIPDTETGTLSGRLSQVKSVGIPTRYLGVLSRFSYEDRPKKYDVLIILSGPEPNRSQIELDLMNELKSYEGQVCLVRGTSKPFEKKNLKSDIKIHDMITSKELEVEINQSEIVLCRSGYSSIMDMAVLGKRAFFIPTKGQYEQEYLARYLSEKNLAYFASEDDFTAADLKDLDPKVRFEGLTMNLKLPVLDFFKRK